MTEVLFGLFGGLAIFIYGMQAMVSGLQKVAGSKMRRILELATGVPIIGVLFGTLVTGIIQSSSLATVLVIGFVNAGLMNLKQAIAVIMGANIGTTFTAQILAFKIEEYALPIIAVGFILYFFANKRKKLKHMGYAIFSLGLVLLGLALMSNSMYPLREMEGFSSVMLALGEHRMLGLLVGTVFTIVIQSSSACIGILLALSTQGLIGLDAAIPIMLGTNIGTCFTSVLASIGTKLTAKRAAFAHVLFNIIGSVAFIIFLNPFEAFVLAFSPADDLPRQIANAHTYFNVLSTVIALPFINQFTNLVIKLFPGEEKTVSNTTEYLDWPNSTSPHISIPLAAREVGRMGEISADNLDKSLEAFIKQDEVLIKEVEELEDLVDYLEREINRYLLKASENELTEEQSIVHTGLLHAANDIERISDHAQNIAQMALFSLEEGLTYSESALDELRDMHQAVAAILRDALTAFLNNDLELAQAVLDRDVSIDEMEKTLRRKHIARLNEGTCLPPSGVIFLDIISNFERVGDHATNIAHVAKGDI